MTKQKTKPLKIGAVFVLLCLCISLPAVANDPGYMNLHSVGGTADESIALDNIRKITFSTEGVDVWQKDETTFTMPYSTLWKITFGEQLPSGIEEIQEEFDETISISYRSTDCCIAIQGKQPIQSVGVYSMQGYLMQQILPGIEQAELSVIDYPIGIYIVRVTDGTTVKTQKIIKK